MKINNSLPTSIALLILVCIESNTVRAMEENEDGSGPGKTTDNQYSASRPADQKSLSRELTHTWEEKGKEKVEAEDASPTLIFSPGLASLKSAQAGTPIPRYPVFDLRKSIPITPLYQGNCTSSTPFVPVDQATEGQAIKTFYKLGQKKWIGKIGAESFFVDDPSSYRTRTKRSIAFDGIREKIAADFYYILSQNRFKTPQTCLSHQPVLNKFTEWNDFARYYHVERGVKSTLRIMSRFVDGYQDLEHATTEFDGHHVSFVDFIKKNHRPPERIHNPEGGLVPLVGIIEMFVAMRVLADTDGLGGSGRNAGFVWERDASGAIIAARAVKIDPGFAFQYILDVENPEGEKISINRVLNTVEEAGNSLYWFRDIRDIQVANNDMSVTVRWQSLTERQQQQFLDALDTMVRALTQSEEDLFFSFYRGGAFNRVYRNRDLNRDEREEIPEETARLLMEYMKKWIALQQKIYHGELTPRQANFHYPPPLGHFVGREKLLGLLVQRLTTPSDTVSGVVLTGLPGMGKSELAKYFAFRERGSYDLIFWLQADTESNLMASYLDLAEVLKISLEHRSTLNAIREEVHAALEQREYPWLLVFDNAEENLVLPKKGGSVIITSQKRDIWHGQDVIAVSPLRFEEVKQFLQRELEEEDLESINALAERCEGIPLIVLGSTIGMLRQGCTISEYLKQIEENTSQEDFIDILWNLVFDHIKEQESQAFEILLMCGFLYPENIPVSWIENMLEHDYDVLAEESEAKASDIVNLLNKYNLIRFDKQRKVFSLHRLLHKALQEYPSDQREYLCDKVLALLGRQSSRFDWNKVDTCHDAKLWSIHADFFVTGQKATSVRDIYLYAVILRTLAGFHRELGNFAKVLDYKSRGLTIRIQKLENKIDPDVAMSLLDIGEILCLQGNYEKALHYCQKALHMLRIIYGERADYDVIIPLLDKIATILQLLSREEEAYEYRQQAQEERSRRKLAFQGICQIHGEKPNLEVAKSLEKIGRELEYRGKHGEKLDYYRKALDIRMKIYGETPNEDVASSLRSISNLLGLLGRKQEACEYEKKVLEIELKCHKQDLEEERQIYGESDSRVAHSLTMMSYTLASLGRPDEALGCIRQSLQIYQQIYEGKPHQDVADSLKRTGKLLEEQGSYEEALERYQHVLQMRKNIRAEKTIPDILDIQGALDPYMKNITNDICRILTLLGRTDEVKRYEQEVLEEELKSSEQELISLRKAYGIEQPAKVAACLADIGRILRSQGKYDQALNYYYEALEFYKKIPGDAAHIDVMMTLETIAKISDLHGGQDEILKYYKQALEIKRKRYGECPVVARLLNKVGELLYSQNKYDEAFAYYSNALQIYQKIEGNEDKFLAFDKVVVVLSNIGKTLFLRGQYEEALNYYHQGLKMGEKIYGQEANPDMAEFLNSIGNVLYSQGQYNESVEYYQQALQMQKELYSKSSNAASNELIKTIESNLEKVKEEQTGNSEKEVELRRRRPKNRYLTNSDPKKRCLLQ